jgi:copper chaperone CopZ
MRITFYLLSIFLSFQVLAAKIEVEVIGMTCGMCVESITKELTATEKADKISVSLENKKAYLEEVKGKKISDTELRAAIKEAGYDARVVLDASGTFNEAKRTAGLQRLNTLGIQVTDYATAAVEMLKDNSSPLAGALYEAIDLSFANIVYQLNDAVKNGIEPLSSAQESLRIINILEAASTSLLGKGNNVEIEYSV